MDEKKKEEYAELPPRLVRAIYVAAYGRKRQHIPEWVWFIAGLLLTALGVKVFE